MASFYPKALEMYNFQQFQCFNVFDVMIVIPDEHSLKNIIPYIYLGI